MTTRRARVWWRLSGGLLAVVAVATTAVLPPATGPAAGSRPPTDVMLALHVHTTRSDGTGTREDVARAAARAGLDAVVVTDHGTAMRPADPPVYLDGVLVIDAVEIGTWGGHYLAIGAAAAPYPLGGEPRAVVEDVARLGGVGLVAHPGSSKDELRWRDWDAPFAGLEWLNADSEWRDRPGRLWRTALAYPWRPVAALTALIDRPEFELDQWDRLASRRPVVGVAGHDAHARLGLRGVGEPYDGWVAFDLPAYAALFGSFANVARLATPLSGEAGRDAMAVTAAIAAGRLYSVLSGLAPPGRLRFDAESDGRRASMGGHLAPGGETHLTFDADVPPAAHTLLLCGGTTVAEGPGGRVTWTAGGSPGACRVEVRVPWAGAERPWLVTNPIYVRDALQTTLPPEMVPVTTATPIAASPRPDAWTVESASDATATITASTVEPDAVDFTWQLGATPPTFAAMQLATPADLAGYDSLVLRAKADRPLRLWLQLRVPDGEGQRWGRSVYLDGTVRELRIPFDTMLPLGPVGQSRPPLADVTSLLVVSDTVHATTGSRGRVTLSALRLAR